MKRLRSTACCCAAMALGLVWPARAEPRTTLTNSRFWQHWGDNRAELDAYDLRITRYGEPRRGLAVAIFVTETFSDALRVKANPGKHPKSDEFPVMKLNFVEDFQTGIYDYNLQTSTFVALESRGGRPPGSTTKISFSAQEWCGHVYEQLSFDATSVRRTLHSYFDGEADRNDTLEYPPNGFAEDAFLLVARGLAHPLIEAGQSARVRVLTSVRRARLTHRSASWVDGEIARSAKVETLKVPAGSFRVYLLSLALADGRTIRAHVEDAWPHRVIRFDFGDGEEGELVGTSRQRYWELHGEGMESALEKLGLRRRPPRTP